MKKLISTKTSPISCLCLILLFCTMVISGCGKENLEIEEQLDKELLKISGIHEEDLYYWYGNRKNPVVVDGYGLLVRSKLIADALRSELERLLKDDLLTYKDIGNGTYLITSKVHFGSFFRRKDVDRSRLFEQLIPAFDIGTPTGEILLKPKEGITISEILEELNDDLTLIKTSKYGYSYAKVNKLDAVFRTTHKIYENGKVEWCQPNFYVEIVLWE